MLKTRTRSLAVLSLAMSATVISGCGDPDTSDGGDVVDGKPFTMAVADDPGSLDPQLALSGTLLQLNAFAYDTLVGVDADGAIVPQLATSWRADATTATLEIKEGVTCSDGTPFTAQTVVDNVDWVSDPANQSQYLGVYLPVGVTAAASDSTITLTLATPAPFLLHGLANLPMVCAAGLIDRDSLRGETAGTGPYVLKKAVPGDHYEYQLRKGYVWGPDGATTAGKGIPAMVTVRVLSNETTAANEVMAGTLNATKILGPDRDRLVGANVEHQDQPNLVGLQWYNQASSRVTSDPEVRMALTLATDAGALRKVLTAGRGSAPTQLAISPPQVCDGDSASGAVPGHDTDAAKAALDAAGWRVGADGIRTKGGKPLSLTFGYATLLGAQAGATSELAVEQWKEIGVEVKAKQMTQTEWSAAFSTGDWDILWLPANTPSPDQLVPLLSGATPPDGNNFAGIENADYLSRVEKAMTQPGEQGCPDWLAAEAALFEAADVVPFANDEISTFAKGATFELNQTIIPTTIKMRG